MTANRTLGKKKKRIEAGKRRRHQGPREGTEQGKAKIGRREETARTTKSEARGNLQEMGNSG